MASPTRAVPQPTVHAVSGIRGNRTSPSSPPRSVPTAAVGIPVADLRQRPVAEEQVQERLVRHPQVDRVLGPIGGHDTLDGDQAAGVEAELQPLGEQVDGQLTAEADRRR